MDDLYARGTEYLRSSQKILIFTGAGLSTDSGIPDFRSPGGVWEKYDPSDFYFQNFISSEISREKYWKMSTEMYETIKDAKPNRAHMAIRKLEEMGKLLAIVTQNIDHLHHKAGNSPEKIIELHGTAVTVSCLSCKKPYDRDEVQERIRSGIKAPSCDDCGGILKPDTVSFGQAMPEEEMNKAMMYAQQSDLCIVLGSSLVVYPAASVPVQAVRGGASLMIINRDPTPHDAQADLVIHDSVSDALEQMLKPF
ncbi:MAG TPA: NAD-dependent protein deacylase [Deltaproteobacteria bacterium]|nr:NAD-dependent protein deacylase [Deltaproteobacteria bacterium]HIJ41078.1 NAD-dependent protein deacylase [Deltaproteobacteria bacterium]